MNHSIQLSRTQSPRGSRQNTRQLRQRFRATISATMLGLLVLAGCARPDGAATRITLAGAQIPVELMESWLGNARRPAFDVHKVGPIYLSQNGFEALRGGLADVAITDRPIGKIERQEFGAKTVVGLRVGFYGYALYVNPVNTLDSVFAGHLRYVFQKKTTDWKELAGPGSRLAGPIRLVGPQKGSRGGEILMRQANIWFDKATWETCETDAQIVGIVAEDPLALGFAAIGLDHGARYLGLRMDRNQPAALPSLEEIESERYGLAKVIYVYHTQPASPAVAALLDFVFGDGGAAEMRSTGVWPLPRARAETP